MVDRKLEASDTVLEAVERTEAILRGQMNTTPPEPEPPPTPRRRGLAAWLDGLRARLIGNQTPEYYRQR